MVQRRDENSLHDDDKTATDLRLRGIDAKRGVLANRAQPGRVNADPLPSPGGLIGRKTELVVNQGR
jgi:hypothetical protein